jgi:hypothetical protein
MRIALLTAALLLIGCQTKMTLEKCRQRCVSEGKVGTVTVFDGACGCYDQYLMHPKRDASAPRTILVPPGGEYTIEPPLAQSSLTVQCERPRVDERDRCAQTCANQGGKIGSFSETAFSDATTCECVYPSS